jgi:hypothetical protein
MNNSADISPNELRDTLAQEQQKCILAIEGSFTRPELDLDMEDANSIVEFDAFTIHDTQEAAMDVGWGSSSG